MEQTKGLLELDVLGKDVFEGTCDHVTSTFGVAYGGHTICLAAKAALMTVDSGKYLINSFQCYYIRGVRKGLVVLRVRRIKDGQIFCFRAVEGLQNNKTVVECLVSFRLASEKEPDLVHNSHPMPLVKKPSQSVSSSELSHFMFDDINNGNVPLQMKVSAPTIWEIRGTKSLTPAPSAEPPRICHWSKLMVDFKGTDQNQQRLAILYASDFAMLGDHSLYFHGVDIDCSKWHLFDIQCLFSGKGGITLNCSRLIFEVEERSLMDEINFHRTQTGLKRINQLKKIAQKYPKIYSEEGELIATAYQQSLVKPKL